MREEFARWNKAGDRVLKGLIRRRQAEARVYASA
ncbi:glycoside hydrolase family protein [Altererythrobacter ishigakiensis]